LDNIHQNYTELSRGREVINRTPVTFIVNKRHVIDNKSGELFMPLLTNGIGLKIKRGPGGSMS